MVLPKGKLCTGRVGGDFRLLFKTMSGSSYDWPEVADMHDSEWNDVVLTYDEADTFTVRVNNGEEFSAEAKYKESVSSTIAFG
jgi:hypothetical protein